MPGDLLISDGQVVLSDRIVPRADVRVRNGIVAEVSEAPLAPLGGEPIVDATGLMVLPGLIDVHCDAIEKEAQPRPGVTLPFEMALSELDRKLALVGITTMYHGVSFGGGEGVRSNELAAELVRAIAQFGGGRALVRHYAHLRCEVSNWQALPMVRDLLEEGSVGLLSLMDHTPGQGQYRNPDRYRHYVRKTYWVGEEEIDRIVAEKLSGRARVREADLLALAEVAERARVPIAGHDPDCRGAVDLAVARGARLLEFPIGLEVGQYAAGLGLHVCVGAPNVLHGRSHDGNLSARDAVAGGAADVLCSDYYPSGLLPAIFLLAELGVCPLARAVAMATLNAATSVGLGGVVGAIQQGLRADLLLVAVDEGRPRVETTIVGGTVVLATRSTRAAAGHPL